MITFEKITEKSLDTVLEIVNSNSSYNKLENGRSTRTLEEINKEFLNPSTESFIIKIENKNIGVIDFLPNNPKDDKPWLGLLMIHQDYQGLEYGRMAYLDFEKRFLRKTYNSVRLGVLEENRNGMTFWRSLGFQFYRESSWNGKTVKCFEKRLG